MKNIKEILLTILAFSILLAAPFFIGSFVCITNLHDIPIAACEAEHDLPRSQTCEMVAVVKGGE